MHPHERNLKTKALNYTERGATNVAPPVLLLARGKFKMCTYLSSFSYYYSYISTSKVNKECAMQIRIGLSPKRGQCWQQLVAKQMPYENKLYDSHTAAATTCQANLFSNNNSAIVVNNDCSFMNNQMN